MLDVLKQSFEYLQSSLDRIVRELPSHGIPWPANPLLAQAIS